MSNFVMSEDNIKINLRKIKSEVMDRIIRAQNGLLTAVTSVIIFGFLESE
jgi:hypothetical protein